VHEERHGALHGADVQGLVAGVEYQDPPRVEVGERLASGGRLFCQTAPVRARDEVCVGLREQALQV